MTSLFVKTKLIITFLMFFILKYNMFFWGKVIIIILKESIDS